MSTYPKNMHVGLLVGSDTDKGPCKKTSTYQTPSAPAHAHDLLDASSPKAALCFKTENFADIKPVQLIDSHAIESPDPKDSLAESITLVTTPTPPPPSPSPSQKASPSSSAHPQPPHAADCIELQTPVSSRRARVGKTMVREAMLQSQLRHSADDATREHGRGGRAPAHAVQTKADAKNHNGNGQPPFRGQLNVIQAANIKMECDDDVLIISDASDKSDSIVSEQCASESIQSVDSSPGECAADERRAAAAKRTASVDEIVDVDEDATVATVKRRKIVEFSRSSSKKTSPNSYKSLIKPSNPKEYLCKADCEKKTKYLSGTAGGAHPSGHSSHSSPITIDADASDRSNDSIQLSSAVSDECIAVDDHETDIVVELESSCESSEDSERCVSIRPSPTPDRSKTIDAAARPKAGDAKKTNGQRELARGDTTTTGKSAKSTAKSQAGTVAATKPTNKKATAKSDAKPKPATKSKTNRGRPQQPATVVEQCSDPEPDTDTTDIESVSSDVSFLASSSHHHNNNNNNDSLMDKNQNSRQSVSPVPEQKSRKGKSRGAKFSNKKRHRVRQLKIEECVLPSRDSSVVPRWSNGWQWIGQPFQGKVFLNVSVRFRFDMSNVHVTTPDRLSYRKFQFILLTHTE